MVQILGPLRRLHAVIIKCSSEFLGLCWDDLETLYLIKIFRIEIQLKMDFRYKGPVQPLFGNMNHIA